MSEHVHELDLVGQVLATLPGVRLALVFGSVARGMARPDSDLDLAVSGAAIDSLALTAAISKEVRRDVHVVRLDEASIPMLEAIIEDGVVVHEALPGAAASWRARTLADLELDRPWYARQRDAWLKRVAAQGI